MSFLGKYCIHVSIHSTPFLSCPTTIAAAFVSFPPFGHSTEGIMNAASQKFTSTLISFLGEI